MCRPDGVRSCRRVLRQDALLAEDARSARWAIVLGMIFVCMGVDDIFQIHERVGKLTGVRWEVLYLPIGFVAFRRGP